ncbi:urease accessory protein UreD [Rhizobiales bacterium RZME27]|uniref:Urease accessory protein UreD n=1 Tax=Endobacterium cereale TaxID=2663029 RepID=A0A6A8AEZ0_9HYPH|nr:urease accessory protein UreD [Endobacterium cereale]MEB2842837.1 urease accessory protein UreD [Endobacterium cereale]MQY49903.1 urease accessory protein UreD [Endobacterium cereale]
MQHQPDHRHAPQRARGEGRLVTKAFEGRTRLAELFQEGCAKIRLPETFSPAMEAVLINTSGGLTGGDRVGWKIVAGGGTAATITTQANEKIYKASSDTATLSTQIEVGEGAVVHWLPQETILFDRSSLTRSLEVDLHDNSEFLAVEAVLLGRKAMGETVANGFFRDRWRIRRGGKLIHAEDLRLDGAVESLSAQSAVLSSQVAFATLFYTGPRAEALLEPLRNILGASNAGASCWNDKLIARITAIDGFALRKILVPAISVLRNGAAVPKVWHI